MSIADELQKLFELHRRGALTDEEYARAKAAVLAGAPEPPPEPPLPDALDPPHDVTGRPPPAPQPPLWAKDAAPFLPPERDLPRPADFRRPRRQEGRLTPTKTGSALGGGCIIAAGVVFLLIAALVASHGVTEIFILTLFFGVVVIAGGVGMIAYGYLAAARREAERRRREQDAD
jgi:hypothetical protein